MAYCGTVTLHDGEGEALHTIRYGRMPKGDAAGLCEGMAGDVVVLLRKQSGLKLQLLCNGRKARQGCKGNSRRCDGWRGNPGLEAAAAEPLQSGERDPR